MVLENRPDLCDQIADMEENGVEERTLFALVNREKLKRVLRVMLSENEFLSDYGIRALSRYHKSNPYYLEVNGKEYSVEYEPAESKVVCLAETPTGAVRFGFPSTIY